MSVTRQLAEFVAAHRYEKLPANVTAATKRAIINILAAAIAGSRTRIGGLHTNMASAMGPGDDASLIGTTGRATAPLAAYANSNLAFALDYEDVVAYTIHAGPIVVPAALAVGEGRRCSGAELINAVVLGYEIGTRIGLSMQPSPERGAQVWGQQYTPFASCAAIAALLGLDATQVDAAFGVTGTYATVPSAYKYFGIVAETRPMREVKLGWGWMSMVGVVGAYSANVGFGGGYGILDGDEGFWIMSGSDRSEPEKSVAGLGDSYYIVETEFKDHPSIYWNHPPHHAITGLMDRHGFAAEHVASVHLRGLGVDRIADYEVAGAVDAQFSLPYTVATTLLREPLGPEMYSDEKLQDPGVRQLMSRVTCEPDPAADLAWFEEHREVFAITVTLKSGEEFAIDVEYPRDKPPIDDDAIRAKFERLAEPVLPANKIARVLELVDGLETLEDVAPLAQSLQP